MSYESSCEAFAVSGCPMREHYDHEDGAHYDRWDGHLGDVDPGGYEHERWCEDQEYYEDQDDYRSSFDDAEDADLDAFLGGNGIPT